MTGSSRLLRLQPFLQLHMGQTEQPDTAHVWPKLLCELASFPSYISSEWDSVFFKTFFIVHSPSPPLFLSHLLSPSHSLSFFLSCSSQISPHRSVLGHGGPLIGERYCSGDRALWARLGERLQLKSGKWLVGQLAWQTETPWNFSGSLTWWFVLQEAFVNQDQSFHLILWLNAAWLRGRSSQTPPLKPDILPKQFSEFMRLRKCGGCKITVINWNSKCASACESDYLEIIYQVDVCVISQAH